MKKIAMMLAALPPAFLVAGYAGGQQLADDFGKKVHTAAATPAQQKPVAAAKAAAGDLAARSSGAADSAARDPKAVQMARVAEQDDSNPIAANLAEARRRAAARMAQPETEAESEPQIASKKDLENIALDPTLRVVKLGSVMVPVHKPRSVTYVVADFGVTVPDTNEANAYRQPETAIRMRDAILTSLTRSASSPIMTGVAIDTRALAKHIRSDLLPNFPLIRDVLFLSIYKQDVPRS
jgi:hypothetical protein